MNSWIAGEKYEWCCLMSHNRRLRSSHHYFSTVIWAGLLSYSCNHQYFSARASADYNCLWMSFGWALDESKWQPQAAFQPPGSVIRAGLASNSTLSRLHPTGDLTSELVTRGNLRWVMGWLHLLDSSELKPFQNFPKSASERDDRGREPKTMS